MSEENDFIESMIGSDSRLDGFLILNSETTEDLLDLLADELAPIEQRKRKRKQADEARYRQCLDTIIANALKARNGKGSGDIFYSRQPAQYSGANTTYLPPFLKADTFLIAVDLMVQAGYLTDKPGHRKTKDLGGARSAFAATDLLVDLCLSFGISSENVRRKLDAPALYLKGYGKQLLPYDVEEHQEMRKDVDRYNMFIQSIGLTDFLYQRDREIIALGLPDPEVAGTGRTPAVQVAEPLRRTCTCHLVPRFRIVAMQRCLRVPDLCQALICNEFLRSGL